MFVILVLPPSVTWTFSYSSFPAGTVDFSSSIRRRCFKMWFFYLFDIQYENVEKSTMNQRQNIDVDTSTQFHVEKTLENTSKWRWSTFQRNFGSFSMSKKPWNIRILRHLFSIAFSKFFNVEKALKYRRLFQIGNRWKTSKNRHRKSLKEKTSKHS